MTEKFVGQFCWFDMETTEPDKAAAFYTALFGWTVFEQPMGESDVYRMFMNNDKPLGGIIPHPPAENAPPPHWTPYIRATDVHDVTEKARELGSNIWMEPKDIPGIRVLSAIGAPDGPDFNPTSLESPGAEVTWPPVPGSVSWQELVVGDLDAAAKLGSYFSTLFGYDVEEMEGSAGYYSVFNHRTQGDIGPIAGLRVAPDTLTWSQWICYFMVPDIEIARAKVLELGGSIVTDVEASEYGSTCIVIDAVGAFVGIHQG